MFFSYSKQVIHTQERKRRINPIGSHSENVNTSEITGPLLATREAALADSVLATTLALGIDLDVVPDREELRRRWRTASLRLVGTDMASRAATLGAVPGVWVVGFDSEELLPASAELGAPALLLPEESQRLAEILSDELPGRDAAQTLALTGASGGLGVSSLAVALATRAAETGLRSVVVELASCGGGLDLLFGAETQEGMTWEELRHAVGEIGDLTPHLVSAERVSVLALGRPHGDSPDEAALSAVLRSLERSHDLVVVDAGDGARLAELGRRVVPLLMVGADVRSVAAARMRAASRRRASAAARSAAACAFSAPATRPRSANPRRAGKGAGPGAGGAAGEFFFFPIGQVWWASRAWSALWRHSFPRWAPATRRQGAAQAWFRTGWSKGYA